MSKERGFTLLEIMCVVITMVLVGTVLTGAFTFLHHVSGAVQQKNDVHHVARMTFLALSRDIHTATSVGINTNAPDTLTLREPGGESIVYKQQGNRIVRLDQQRARIIGDGISGLSFASLEPNNRLVCVMIESVEMAHARIVTNLVSVDLACRNGCAP